MEKRGEIGSIRVRPARETEAGRLSGLSMRSKAHWGYDEAFMQACRDELTITVEEIGAGEVFVLERADDRQILGTFSLEPRGSESEGMVMDLGVFFLEPELIGQGLGRVMMEAVKSECRDRGFATLVIQADPNAEAFYRAMGGRRVGELASASIPGRTLPLMELDLMP